MKKRIMRNVIFVSSAVLIASSIAFKQPSAFFSQKSAKTPLVGNVEPSYQKEKPIDFKQTDSLLLKIEKRYNYLLSSSFTPAFPKKQEQALEVFRALYSSRGDGAEFERILREYGAFVNASAYILKRRYGSASKRIVEEALKIVFRKFEYRTTVSIIDSWKEKSADCDISVLIAGNIASLAGIGNLYYVEMDDDVILKHLDDYYFTTEIGGGWPNKFTIYEKRNFTRRQTIYFEIPIANAWLGSSFQSAGQLMFKDALETKSSNLKSAEAFMRAALAFRRALCYFPNSANLLIEIGACYAYAGYSLIKAGHIDKANEFMEMARRFARSAAKIDITSLKWVMLESSTYHPETLLKQTSRNN